jgi:hypothetical protein
MKPTLVIIFLTIMSITGLYAQVDHDHEGHNHHDHKNEFAISNAPVWFMNEKELAYGAHLHYLRAIPNSRFSIGIAYERIFDEHGHNTIGLTSNYRVTEYLNFSLSPGLAFEDINGEPKPAIHFETSYDFPIGDFHIGPAFDFAWDTEDSHISLGLHIGYGF